MSCNGGWRGHPKLSAVAVGSHPATATERRSCASGGADSERYCLPGAWSWQRVRRHRSAAACGRPLARWRAGAVEADRQWPRIARRDASFTVLDNAVMYAMRRCRTLGPMGRRSSPARRTERRNDGQVVLRGRSIITLGWGCRSGDASYPSRATSRRSNYSRRSGTGGYSRYAPAHHRHHLGRSASRPAHRRRHCVREGSRHRAIRRDLPRWKRPRWSKHGPVRRSVLSRLRPGAGPRRRLRPSGVSRRS